MHLERVGDGPIIDPSTCDSIGFNIQGPSLIRMPEWSPGLGRYHLYFADHKGRHIRLAYADDLAGPWTVHRPGALSLEMSCFPTEAPESTGDQIAQLHAQWRRVFGGDYSADEVLIDATTPHIASPDVHVDHDARQFVMYFHGLDSVGVQCTRVATSSDGVVFDARPEVVGDPYFRVFDHDGWRYALAMPGQLLRSRDGLTGFEVGPRLFEPDMRHSAVMVRDGGLDVWWTRVGDAPEAILWSRIDLAGDWTTWRESEPVVVLEPELSWQGADAPIEPSRRGAVHGLVNQLRDPCVFVDVDGSQWLLYAGGGESCIGLARVVR